MASKTGRKRGRPISREAVFRRIAAEIRTRLRAGEWSPGEVLPSIRALAKHYDVGACTVRLAVELLKAEGRVRTSARRRLVAAAPEDAVSATDRLVLQVVSGRLDTRLRERYFPEINRGIALGAGETGASILTVHHPRLGHVLPADALGLPVTGAVLVGSFEDALLDQYARLNIPVVLADQPAQGRGLHSVSVDNYSAARRATARLVRMGHRRIAFLRFVNLEMRHVEISSEERQEGFLAALREAGLPADASRLFNAFYGDTPESPSVQAVLRAAPSFTAVLVVSVGRAMIMAEAARKAKRSVPEDLSIVCFQEDPPSHPEFSGPRTDFEDLGRRAVHLLAEPPGPARQVLVPAEWADGETAAPPRG